VYTVYLFVKFWKFEACLADSQDLQTDETGHWHNDIDTFNRAYAATTETLRDVETPQNSTAALSYVYKTEKREEKHSESIKTGSLILPLTNFRNIFSSQSLCNALV